MKIKFTKVHEAWNTLRQDNPIKVGDIAELDGHIITLEDKSQLDADELCKSYSNSCSYSDIFDNGKRYDINSPDGFSMTGIETYRSPEDAWRAFDQWLKRFEQQGYYSSTNHGKIPLDQVKQYCSLVTINHTEDE
jgi:hypothetical protein